MLKEGLLSTLKGEHMRQGTSDISGNTAFNTCVSVNLVKTSVLLILDDVLPIIIGFAIEGLEGKRWRGNH
jgi:hypothetical protein